MLIVGGFSVCNARGRGIQAGSGRLHPSLDLDMVYDSNATYRADNAVSDMVLKLRPGLTLSFPSDVVSFELSGKVGYDFYMGVQQSATKDLGAVAGDATMKVGFNPKGQFAFFIEDSFTRTGDPRYNALTGKFDRTDNEAKARVQWRPGGGAIMFDAAYGFFLDLFDESSTYPSSAMSNYGHRIYFNGKWKFLPKTAVTLSFDSDLRKYTDSYPNTPEMGDLAGQKNTDINAIRVKVGLLGQISPTLSVVMNVGYGDSLIGDDNYGGEDFRSVIGQAEATYRAGTTFIQGGYLRNFQPVALFAYFGIHRLYLNLRQQLGGKFSISADASCEFMNFGEFMSSTIQTSQGSRSDVSIRAGVTGNYHIQEWLSVGLNYKTLIRVSEWGQPADDSSVEYNKHLFALQIEIDY
jgi:hypothetical protein